MKNVIDQILEIKGSYLALFFFIVNLVLKVVFIEYPDVSLDEPFTIFHSQQDLSDLFTLFANENNPPLFFLITHFAIKCFGISTWAVRLFPVLFSGLTVYFLMKFVQRYFDNFSSLIVGVLFTFSNYQFFISHEARAYGLFGLLLVLSFDYFLRLMNSTSKFDLVILSLLNVLLIYNHFFGFFIPFVQLLSCVAIKKYRSNFLSFCVSGFITMVLYSPYLYVLFLRFSESSGGTWVEEPTVTSLYYVLWAFCNMPLPTIISLVILLVGSVYLSIKRKLTDEFLFLLIAFAVPYVLMFALSFKMPMFIPKYLIHVSIPFYVLIGVSLTKLPMPLIGRSVLGLALCIMFVVTFKPKENKLEVTKLVSWVKENKTDNMVVLFVPEYFDIQFFYHYDKEDFMDYKNFTQRINAKGFYGVNSLSELPLGEIGKSKEVLFIGSGAQFVDPEMKIKAKLSMGAKQGSMSFYHNDDVVLYSY